jgi:hypothetical protein
MTTSKPKTWKGLTNRQSVVILSITVALVGVIGIFAVMNLPDRERIHTRICDKLCQVTLALDEARDENVDLRAKTQKLKDALQEKDEKKTYPPDSRHFYDCKPAKKKGDWNLMLYSNTTNQLWAWRCDSWRGHTSQKYILPETERKKVTCTDQSGVTYPYGP